MFAVDDIDATVAGLRALGAELVGEVAQYQDSYRLCYVRGPEGSMVAFRLAVIAGADPGWPSSSANGPSQSTCDQPERSAWTDRERQWEE
jgi:hypothetical protein